MEALDPIAFTIGPLSVHWYGIILGTGALLGLFLAVKEGKKFGISSDFFMDLLLIGAPSAILGARLYYVFFRWDYYSQNPSEMFAVWHGGLAIHGALIGAVIAGVIYVRKKRYPFWHIADICAPGLIAGQIIGRWGNFMNQEAYGGPVSEAFLRDYLNLPDWIVNQMFIEGAYRHPTFLYESLWNLAGLCLLLFIRRTSFVRDGEVFLSYLIWYSVGRFFIEGLRTDSLAFTGPGWLEGLLEVLWSPMVLAGFEPGHMAYGNIRMAQLIGVLIILSAVFLFVFRRMTGRAAYGYLERMKKNKGADA